MLGHDKLILSIIRNYCKDRGVDTIDRRTVIRYAVCKGFTGKEADESIRRLLDDGRVQRLHDDHRYSALSDDQIKARTDDAIFSIVDRLEKTFGYAPWKRIILAAIDDGFTTEESCDSLDRLSVAGKIGIFYEERRYQVKDRGCCL